MTERQEALLSAISDNGGSVNYIEWGKRYFDDKEIHKRHSKSRMVVTELIKKGIVYISGSNKDVIELAK